MGKIIVCLAAALANFVWISDGTVDDDELVVLFRLKTGLVLFIDNCFTSCLDDVIIIEIDIESVNNKMTRFDKLFDP